MKKRNIKLASRIGCVALALVIAATSGGTAFASASSTQKDETVYVNLDPNGKVKKTTVSDWLHSDNAAAQFLDKSDLSGIKNVKSNETPKKDGDSLIWQLSKDSTDKTGSNIYYEGTTDKTLPLSVSVTYYLNGKEIKPSALAGKSGKVEMKINVQNNDKHMVNINGKQTAMYMPMTALVLTKLPTDTFSNVTLSDGKLISDGTNQFVTFVTMPGFNESLNLTNYSDIPELSGLDFSEGLDIKADVKNFKLDNISVAATPELVDSDKLKDATDIDEMRTNLNKLKKIQDDIENIDSDKRIRSLFTDPDRTAAARLLIDDVFDFYGLDTKLTELAPEYVTDSNIKLYDRVTSDLDKADIKYLLDNKVLRGIDGRLTDENINKSRTLLKDYDDVETFDMSKLDEVLNLTKYYDKLYGKYDRTMDDAQSLVDSMFDSRSDAIDALDVMSDSWLLKKTSSALHSYSKLQKSLSDLGIKSSSIDEKKLAEALVEAVFEQQAGISEDDMKDQMAGFISVLQSLQSETNNKSFTSNELLYTIEKIAKQTNNEDSLSSLKKLLENETVKDELVKGIIKAGGMKDSNYENVSLPLSSWVQIFSGLSDSIQQTVSQTESAIVPQIVDLMDKTESLQSAMDDNDVDIGDIRSALDTASTLGSHIRKLKDDLDDIDDADQDDFDDTVTDARELLDNRSDMHYLINWGNKIKTMKGDLDDNTANVNIMRDLLKQYDDPKIKNAKHMYPVLQKDLDDTRPVLESLKDKLDEPEMNASLHKLPQTTNTLLKMKDDINGNRTIMDIFKKTMEPGTVSVFNYTFNTLDDFKSKGTVDDYTKKLDDADELMAKKDAYINLSDNYKIFSKAADGAKTKIKFVMKTDEIKASDKSETVTPVSTQNSETKKSGFFGWVKSVWSGTVKMVKQIF